MLKTKRISLFLLISSMLFVLCSCGAPDERRETPKENINTGTSDDAESSDRFFSSEKTEEQESSIAESSDAGSNSTEIKEDSKILIAYFSRADENYAVGYIEKGNTAIIAEMIAEGTGGELFHIERATSYPADYKECTDEAKQEQNDNARPALAEDKDISEYDVIFLGYPIWWADMPMPVYTFLEGHDFSGKTIIPFCTHEGSGLSGTEKSIENICVDSEILDGLSIKGTDAQNSQDEAKKIVNEWLGSLSY